MGGVEVKGQTGSLIVENVRQLCLERMKVCVGSQ